MLKVYFYDRVFMEDYAYWRRRHPNLHLHRRPYLLGVRLDCLDPVGDDVECFGFVLNRRREK